MMKRIVIICIYCICLGGLWACEDNDEKSPAGEVIATLGSSEFLTLENITPLQIPVVLSAPVTHQVTVNGYIRSEQNAREGVDYTFMSKKIEIPAGKTTGYFQVELKDYPEYVEDRVFEFEVVGVEGAKLTSPDICRVTIRSNEGLPRLGFVRTLQSVAEEIPDEELGVVIDRKWQQEVSFRLRVVDEKSTAVYGADYFVDTTRVYTIAAGDTLLSIPLTVVDNTIENEDVHFELELYGNTESVILDAYQGMKVTILDDEEPTFVCFDRTKVQATESEGPVWIPVRVKGNTKLPVKVNLEVRGGSAVEGKDYVFEQHELIFPAGVKLDSVKVDFIDNDLNDVDRSLQIGFAAVEGAALASSDTLIQVAILNDDFDFEQLYEQLMGEWTMLMPGGGNVPASVTVTVSGGDTPEEEDANYLKYLVVSCPAFGEGKFAARWRLSYDVSTGALAVVLGEVITKDVPFSGGKRDIKWDRGAADQTDPVTIFPSKDYRTLKYDPAVEIRGGGYDSNGKRDIWWLTVKNAVMLRENN